jgi:hypothetical protein
MDRRAAIKLLGSGFVGLEQLAGAQHGHSHGASGKSEKPWVNYQPRAFTVAEYETLSEFAEVILPDEPGSPGAKALGLAYFMDVVVFYGTAEMKRRWKGGLAALDVKSRGKFDAEFRKLSPERRVEVVAEIARRESRPVDDVEHFFVEVKQTTIAAWGYSEEGAKLGLGYRGNVAIPTFVGCTHDHG